MPKFTDKTIYKKIGEKLKKSKRFNSKYRKTYLNNSKLSYR